METPILKRRAAELVGPGPPWVWVPVHGAAGRDGRSMGLMNGIGGDRNWQLVGVLAAAGAVIEKLKGHPLFAHVTLVRSERSQIAALVTEMLEDVGL